MLRMLGYSVYIFKDEEEALSHYYTHHSEIDLVILDLIMPRITGNDMLVKMREKKPSQKIIMMSGMTKKGSIPSAINGFLEKPFNISKLSREVANALHGEMVGS